MQVRERYVKRNDPHAITLLDKRAPVSVCDPGAHGAIVNAVVENGAPALKSVHAFGRGNWVDQMVAGAAHARDMGITTLVIEDQYMTPYKKPAPYGMPQPDNGLAQNVKSLSRRAQNKGLMAGVWLAAMAGWADVVDIVYVPPSVWAARVLGLSDGRSRAALKEKMFAVADQNLATPEYRSLRKIDKEGVAASYCITRWWVYS